MLPVREGKVKDQTTQMHGDIKARSKAERVRKSRDRAGG